MMAEKLHRNNPVTFSVIIPLYNNRAYIRRAVDSVLAQTYQDFEILVIDDGSTDGGTDVLQDVTDSRLNTIRQPNQGVGAARNTGMYRAQGAWLALLDADDAWLPEHLAALLELTESFPQAGLVSSAHIEAVNEKIPEIPSKNTYSNGRIVDYFLYASYKIGFINSTSVAIRNDVYKNIGGFTHVRIGEDLEYWARIALSYPVAFSDKITCVYFRNTNGVMQQIENDKSLQRHPEITQLQEVSPPVKLLCEHARQHPSLWKNPTIRAYINCHVTLGIKNALYHFNINKAKQFGNFFLHPLMPRFFIYLLLAKLPTPLINQIMLMHHYRKRLLLRVQHSPELVAGKHSTIR